MAERIKQKICTEEDAHYLYNKIRARLDTKVNSEEGKGLSSFDFSQDYKDKLDGLDGTIDSAKNELTGKLEKLEGEVVKKDGDKGLSENDFTDELKYTLERLKIRMDMYHFPIYTIRIDKKETDPKKKVTYEDDAAFMTPVAVDAQHKIIQFGDWESSPIWDKIAYIMLDKAGTEQQELNPSDFTKTTAGLPSEFDTRAKVMGYDFYTRFDTFYIRGQSDDSSWKFSFCTEPLPGFTPIGFLGEGGTTLNRIYVSGFLAHDEQSQGNHRKGLRCFKSTDAVYKAEYPTALSKIQTDYSDNPNYSLFENGQRLIINLLFMLLFRTTDARSALPKASVAGYKTEHGIGWDDNGGPVFLGLHNYVKTSSDPAEHFEGLMYSRIQPLYYKQFKPFTSDRDFTSFNVGVGFDNTLPISTLSILPNNWFTTSVYGAEGSAGENFVDHHVNKNQADDDLHTPRMHEGIWGTEFSAKRTGGDGETGAVRLVYQPPAVKAVDDE